MKIAVVFGGKSSEREVSIDTKDAVCNALESLNLDYIALELDSDLAARLREEKIDLVFNSCHGTFGEDGRLSSLLDILEIPYTHAGTEAAQIGMNKLVSKKLAEEIGVRTPKFALIEDIQNLSSEARGLMKNPFVIKPVNEGSSVGVEIILEPEKFSLEEKHKKYGMLIIEEYIKGTEIHAAIINNKAIGAVEIKPKGLFYDYDAKYKSGDTEYITPPNIEDGILQKLLGVAGRFHNFIECNYISRVDFLVRDDEVYFLEINTHPGFTGTSLVPKVAKEKGMEFQDIVKGLVESARCKLD